jgi:hypothetical protein
MGVSGTLYPIGSYPYAQNDLKNLCWTLSNLKEAGYTYTNNPGKSEDRGYYYLVNRAPVGGPDDCSQKLGSAWRVPTNADWDLLKNGFADLVASEREPWVTAPASLGGYVHADASTSSAMRWDQLGAYLANGYAVYGYSFAMLTIDATGAFGLLGTMTTYGNYDYVSARCVRDL